MTQLLLLTLVGLTVLQGMGTSPISPSPRYTDGGKKCVFPFTYNGKTYTDCTDVGASREWCSLDKEYNGDWDFCEIVTPPPPTTTVLPPTPSPKYTVKGEKCALPFTYNGKTYTDCTNADTGVDDIMWCSLEPEYNGNWGYCEGTTTPSLPKSSTTTTSVPKPSTTATLPSAPTCVFPFIYDNVTQTTCVEGNTGDWCATTENYDEDVEWMWCSSPKYTVKGEKCALPFTYNGKTYTDCTDVGASSEWCSLDHEYNGDWAYCEVITTPSVPTPPPAPTCVFPFIYDNVTQTTCVEGQTGDWCATTENYDEDEEWMWCPSPKYTVKAEKCALPFTYKGETYTDCTDAGAGSEWCSLDHEYNGDWAYCEVITTPSVPTPPPAPTCVFPFIYDNVAQTTCVKGKGGDWCATTENYDEDAEWMWCPSPKYTVKGEKCALPFTYNGETYTDCTDVGASSEWCSLDHEYNGEWAYCKKI